MSAADDAAYLRDWAMTFAHSVRESSLGLSYEQAAHTAMVISHLTAAANNIEGPQAQQLNTHVTYSGLPNPDDLR